MKATSRPTVLVAALATLGAAPIHAQDDAAESKTVASKAGPMTLESLVALEHPWGMDWLPGDTTLLLTEKVGNLRTWTDGELSAPIQNVPEVVFEGQGGLMDVVVAPDFAQTREIWFGFVEMAPPEEQVDIDSFTPDPRLGPYPDGDVTTVKGLSVARARLSEDLSRLEDVEVTWRQMPRTMGLGQYGGRLAFASDGTLYVTNGDRQRFEPAQELDTTIGKVVRLDRDGKPADGAPTLGDAAADGIWTLGHRNPLGLAVDPATGEVWTHEMGPFGGDELNRLEPGANYGWPLVSYGSHYNHVPIPNHEIDGEYAQPEWFWYPSVSPSGMAFYTEDLVSDWQGSIFIGALSGESLLRLDLKEGRIESEERLDVNLRVRDVIQAPDGTLLLMKDGPDGALMRLAPEAPR